VSGPTPFTFEASAETKRYAPATLRNRDDIVAVLRNVLPTSGTVLEIASGTGEHAAYFAAAFPHLEWQPSDHDEAGLESIEAWRGEVNLDNLRPPVCVDAAGHWPELRADAVLCINMVHISPWSASLGLFRGAADVLRAGAPLYLYGPYKRRGVATAESNLAFDQSLKARNPDWGLRDIDDVTGAAREAGFILDQVTEMPANNLSVVYRRR
jgi:SAM-dependent methyltransferase